MTSISSYTTNRENCVANDMCTAGVNGADAYSTIGQVDQSLKVPLGSQLALLSAMSAGNPYLNYNRVFTPMLGANATKLSGFNTMGQNTPGGQYMNFAQAYSSR